MATDIIVTIYSTNLGAHGATHQQVRQDPCHGLIRRSWSVTSRMTWPAIWLTHAGWWPHWRCDYQALIGGLSMLLYLFSHGRFSLLRCATNAAALLNSSRLSEVLKYWYAFKTTYLKHLMQCLQVYNISSRKSSTYCRTCVFFSKKVLIFWVFCS